MVRVIKGSPLSETTSAKFVDLMDDEADRYPKELQFIDKGYQLPVTFINGKASFAGRVDHEKLIVYIERAANQ